MKPSELLLQSAEPFDQACLLVRKMEEEVDYLEWFVGNCDFGPAHEDVVYLMQQEYEEETGKKVPESYRLNN